MRGQFKMAEGWARAHGSRTEAFWSGVNRSHLLDTVTLV
jgi:hypothetical protein